MCQPKGKGGRCFRHTKGTTANINYIYAKTGVDKDSIYGIMKELKKEGRQLPDPSTSDVEQYFSSEEFKTKMDGGLNEKERVRILKDLLAARSEARQYGVKGGTMHAWKNGLKTVVKKAKRPLIAAGLVGVVAFSATGCAGSLSPEESSTPKPTSSTSQTVDPSIQSPAGLDIYKTEKDDSGEYSRVTLKADSPLYKLDKSKLDSTVASSGLNDKEITEAQKFTSKLLVEETFDSTALDKDTWNSWKDSEASKYILASELASITANNGSEQSPFIATKNNLHNPLFIRDGGSRISEADIKVTKISGGKHDALGSFLQISYESSVKYRVSDAEVVKYFNTENKDASVTEKAALQSKIFDGKDENVWSVTSNVTYGVARDSDGNWKIGGIDNYYTSKPVDWFNPGY